MPITNTKDGTVTHVGMVVGTGSTYWGDGDSGYWALVFDGEKAETVSTGSTYDGWVPYATATPDIDADMLAKLAAMVRPKVADAFYAAATKGWSTIKVGDMATVTAGRKVPHGFIVKVKWIGPDKYDRWGTRAAFDDPITGERVFMAGHNLTKVYDAEAYSDAALAAWNRAVAMSDADVVRMHYKVHISG